MEDSLAALQKLLLDVATEAEQVRDETRQLIIGVEQVCNPIRSSYRLR